MKNINEIDRQNSETGILSADNLVLDDTRAFLAVARHGTLSQAAKSLNIGIATLSRRIDRLEKALAQPLFVRQQTGYSLTVDGANLLDKAEAIESAAHAFTTGARVQTRVSGKVRLATAENLATALILPVLPAFHRQYPDLSIEIVTDINTVNLHRRDADLAIRMVKPERGHLTLRRLGTLGYGLYCSNSYADTRSTQKDSADYDNDSFITWTEMQAHFPAAQWFERTMQGKAPTVSTTTLASQLAAAKAGLGLSVLPHFLAQEAGLRCLEADIGVEQPIYLVMHTDLVKSRRIRVLADFLSELIESQRERLSGVCKRRR